MDVASEVGMTRIRGYDDWLNEHYDYQGDGCHECWVEDHQDATDEQIDAAQEDMGLCGVHEHAAYVDYISSEADRVYDEMRDRQMFGG